jgi:predicted DsbA family dithiol-disulfide isomerase
MDLIKRNLPVVIIGIVTLLIFLGIIVAGQRNPTIGPELREVDQENLIDSHTYTLGNPEAPVTLVEFADYECPACAAFHPVTKRLYEENSELLRIAYRHFPLPQNPDARRAAEAAQAAGEQGKFWEYHALLFQNNRNLSRGDLIRYAEMIELDLQKFETDLNDNRFASMVNEDLSAARNLGLTFTPTFFLNGKLMSYSTFEDFENQILAELERYSHLLDNVNESTQSNEVLGITRPASPTTSEADQEYYDYIDDLYGILEISYTDEGFSPNRSNAAVGRLVRFSNDTDNEITLVQATDVYEVFKRGVILQPGESFEIRLTELKLFNIREKETQRLSSTTVFSPPGR